MNKRALLILLILICIGLCYAATSDPWDGSTWDVTAPDIDQPHGNTYKEIYDLRKGVAIRVNKEHETLATSSAGGVHKQGSARAFFQDAAPTTQVDTSAFDAGDLGSLWFDSNASPDNQFNVLTATTPTWTPISTEVIAVLLAANRTFAGTLTVTGESTFNNHVNLGAGDDLIGSATSDITINTNKFTVAGATGNTVIAGTLTQQGVATLADTSALATSGAPAADAQIANKKYVDDQIAAIQDPSYTGGESHTLDGGLIIKSGWKNDTGTTTTVTFGTAFPNAFVSAQVTGVETNTSVVWLNQVGSTTTIVVKRSGDVTGGFYWMAIGY